MPIDREGEVTDLLLRIIPKDTPKSTAFKIYAALVVLARSAYADTACDATALNILQDNQVKRSVRTELVELIDRGGWRVLGQFEAAVAKIECDLDPTPRRQLKIVLVRLRYYLNGRYSPQERCTTLLDAAIASRDDRSNPLAFEVLDHCGLGREARKCISELFRDELVTIPELREALREVFPESELKGSDKP